MCYLHGTKLWSKSLLKKYLFQVRFLHCDSTGSVLDFTVLSEVWCIVKNETFLNHQVSRIMNLSKRPFLLFTFLLFLCRSSCWNRQWMPEFAVWFSGLLPLWRMTADFWSFSLLHLAEQASSHALYLQFASCVNNPWSETWYTSLTLPTTSKS